MGRPFNDLKKKSEDQFTQPLRNMHQTIQLIREEFFKALEAKTGWGRNHVKEAFERAVSNALARRLDKGTPLEGVGEQLDLEIETPAFEFERPAKDYTLSPDEQLLMDDSLSEVMDQPGDAPWDTD